MDASSLAVQLWTVREYLGTPEGIAETIEKIARLGYTAVELAGLGPIEMKDLKKLLDGADLACCSAHQSYARLLAEPAAVGEEMTILGAKYVACAALPEDLRNEAGLREGAKRLSEAGAKLAEKGVTLAYHNHSFEFERFGDRLGLEILYDESDPQFLQAQIDTYWVQHGGASPAAWCRRLKGRLPMLHLKDMGVADGEARHAEIGEGNLDWPAILAAAREAGTQWYIVELGATPHEPIESLRISFENLRKMGA